MLLRAGIYGISNPGVISIPVSGGSAAVMGVNYLLHDDFTDTRAAGSVNGTPATPGPGTRWCIDPNNYETVGGGALTWDSGVANASHNDPGHQLNDTITSQAGTINVIKFNLGASGRRVLMGYKGTADLVSGVQFGGTRVFGYVYNTNILNRRVTGVTWDQQIGSVSLNTDYCLYFVLRRDATNHLGAHIYLKGGLYTNPTLLYSCIGTATDASLKSAITTVSGVPAGGTFDFQRVPETLWLPTPLAYATFASWGTTEGYAGEDGIGDGGGGLTWVNQVGTVTASGGSAIASVISGGRAIATVDVSEADALVSALLTKGTTGCGIVLRYTDTSNYIYAWHDGTNAYLVKRVAGVETTSITSAKAYLAGKNILCIGNGSDFWLHYNDNFCNQATISDAGVQSGTKVGIIFFDTDSTIDNFYAYKAVETGLTKYGN